MGLERGRDCGVAGVEPEQAYALVIGISKYRDTNISNLKFTHADAEAFYDLLVDPEKAGFLKENVRLLRDQEANLNKMKSSISKWLFERVKPGSTVLFFFAGHGGHEPDKLDREKDGIAKYLLPWDADPGDLYASALSSTQLQEMFQMIKADRVVFFMDACYAAGVASGARARDLAVVSPTFRRLATGKGRLIISAAQANQRSWEDESIGHGIFTHHLIEALEGKADPDGDGCVSIFEVYKYLEREIPSTAKRLASALQEPMWAGELSTDIVLPVSFPRMKMRSEERKAEEEKRLAAINGKRQKLCELRNANELPLLEFTEAMELIEKQPSELSAHEAEIQELLDVLFSGAIPPRLYLSTRRRIREPASVPKRFCIHCGAAIGHSKKFCTRCGRPLVV